MIEIRLFGAIGVSVDGAPVEGLTLKQRQVLAILALSQGTPVTREALADQLWEGELPRTWVGTLDSYVCVLRRALRVGAGRESALATGANGFVLHADVDLGWFHRLAAVASAQRSHVGIDWAEEALDLVTAEPLGEVPYAAWADRARERFHHAFVELGTHAARRANGTGEFHRAAVLARRVVERDPVCEAAWTQLMLAHWFSGDQARALTAYAELREHVVERLGEEPGRAAHDLYVTILRTPLPESPAHSGPEDGEDEGVRVERVRGLLRLLRHELEQARGVRVPALDADLSECAALLLGRR